MQWWMRPGPSRCWAIRKPAPRGPSSASAGHAHVLVDDLGVPAVAAVVLVRVLHRRDVAQDLHARRVDGHDQHRGALVLVRVGVGDRHHDQEVRHRRVGGEPLAAVDDPLVAVEHRGGLEQRRVRAGGVRLGHRERGLQVAGQQRVQPLLLLVLRAGQREDLRVARVGRRVAEHDRGERRRAEDLVHQAELDLAEALAAELGVQVRRPQAALAHLLLQRRDQPPEGVVAELAEDRLDRPDLLAHEGAHPVQLLLELGLGREIPGHACVPPSESVPVPESRVAVMTPLLVATGVAVFAGAALQAATGLRLRAAGGAAGVRRARPARGDRPAAAARHGDRRADARHRGPPAAADGPPLRDRARVGGARRGRGRRRAARARRVTLQIAVSVGVAATLIVRRRAPAERTRAGAALGGARDRAERRRARDLDEHERAAAAALPARPRRRARARARHAHGHASSG